MEWLIPLLLFVLVSTVTPGPNNLLLAASGLRFGVRGTLPHLLGIHIGVYGLVILSGLGLGQLLVSLPGFAIGLKIFATGYLVYLAWQILGLRLSEGSEVSRPMRTWEAGLFQLSNPKAWMMAITGLNLALVAEQSMPMAVLMLCLGFATLGTLCNLVWIVMGASLQAHLQNPFKRRLINGGLALATVLTIGAFWLY